MRTVKEMEVVKRSADEDVEKGDTTYGNRALWGIGGKDENGARVEGESALVFSWILMSIGTTRKKGGPPPRAAPPLLSCISFWYPPRYWFVLHTRSILAVSIKFLLFIVVMPTPSPLFGGLIHDVVDVAARTHAA